MISSRPTDAAPYPMSLAAMIPMGVARQRKSWVWPRNDPRTIRSNAPCFPSEGALVLHFTIPVTYYDGDSRRSLISSLADGEVFLRRDIAHM
jgi:hypothetical protein